MTVCYKTLYEYTRGDVEELKGMILGNYDRQAKADLGDLYFDYKDLVIVQELTSILDDLEKPDWDIHETPNNKAHDISAIYRVLEYFMRHKDYQEFVKARRKLNKGDT